MDVTDSIIVERELVLYFYSPIPETYSESPRDADSRLKNVFLEIVGAVTTQCQEFQKNDNYKVSSPDEVWRIGKMLLERDEHVFELEYINSSEERRLVFSEERDILAFRFANGEVVCSNDLANAPICLDSGLAFVREFLSDLSPIEGGLQFVVSGQ
jgi:hypothetical protein